MTISLIKCIASIGVLAGAAASQGSLFPVSYVYPADDAPSGSALADINADGNLDYLVANYFTDTVGVYLGTGTGSLNAQPSIHVGGQPRGLTMADLNGDGRPDLVTVNATSGSVSVLLGLGAGAFAAPAIFPAGSFPVAIEAGDVNGDGNLDVVVADQTPSRLVVLLGNGTGTLAPPSFKTLGASPERIRLADMNGDGNLDCVCACWLDDRVIVLLGNGSGGFAVSASTYSPSPKGLAVGEVTGDGYNDVVVVSSQYDVAYLFRGLNGLLAPPETYYLGSNTYATSAMLADASGDGRLDLIVCGASSPALRVFIGVGGPTYFEFAHASPIPESAYDAVAGDLNGDGFADVVTSNLTVDTIRAHVSAGVGSWQHYCTAKINSLGCTPKIEATGTPSVSNPRPFWVSVRDVFDHKSGIIIYRVNGAHASIPFQGGTLCLGPGGVRRTPVKNSSGDPKVASPNCSGVYILNFNAFAQGLSGGNPDPALLVVGNSYQVQVWSRDPGFQPPNDAGLSSALDVTPWL